jgi:hypothetical protein
MTDCLISDHRGAIGRWTSAEQQSTPDRLGKRHFENQPEPLSLNPATTLLIYAADYVGVIDSHKRSLSLEKAKASAG